ncbi:cytochrome P450 [Mycena amicta]|nr:cytochrome P450 [Mycena amicta]
MLDALQSALIVAAVVAGVYSLRTHWQRIRDDHGIGSLPGPPSSSWIFGHMRELMLSPQYGAFEFAWQKTYGSIYRLKGCFGKDRLVLADPQTMAHVLSSPDFEHTPSFEHTMCLVEGELSLSYIHGNMHRRIRNAMAPGFSAEAVPGYEPAFQTVATELVDAMRNLCAVNEDKPIDVCPPLAAATLGVVSRGVFGLAIEDLGKELLQTMAEMSVASRPSPDKLLMDALASPSLLPLTMRLPFKPFRVLRRLRELSQALGKRVVHDKMAETTTKDRRTDVFSRLVSTSSFGDSKQLTPAELSGQTGRFLIAGTQSATHAMSFALFELARDEAMQEKIRQEVLQTQSPHSESQTPLLSAFVKEILRFYSGVPLSERIAVRDTVIPLPLTENSNSTRVLKIRRGDVVVIATASYHRNVAVWGVDADEFKPSRWSDPSRMNSSSTYGPYANLSTFLAGSRTCPGWRFVILELHTLLSALLRNIAFSLPSSEAVGGVQLQARLAGALMPIAAGTGKKEVVLKLKVLDTTN